MNHNNNLAKVMARRKNQNQAQKPKSGYSVEQLTKERVSAVTKNLRKDWNLSQYKDFFPEARAMKRKHIFFAGPTNSGKSYRGFNELSEGNSGLYLSPLRLLALEGQEEVEKRGKPCSLLTGEEMELKEDAAFTASTIEMANLDVVIDCALIDEVQLILDENRGWAWTQAIVGLQAKKIVMTGSEECIPTLKKLIEEYLGEELEIVRLNRMVSYEVMKSHSHDLAHVEPNTAIIAFSRRAVLSLKKELEDAGRKVSVLYGNLSPGVRREEARRFRSGETEILIATDCIGMGLNLPIKTVIFSEVEKFDGTDVRLLSIQEVKQIGGRAGRFGQFDCGYVGATSRHGLDYVKAMMAKDPEAPIQPGFVRPTLLQLEILKDQLGASNIESALKLFRNLGNQGKDLICSGLKEMIVIAARIEEQQDLARMSFSDKYLFVCSPVSTDDTMEKFIEWIYNYVRGWDVRLNPKDYEQFTINSYASDDRTLNQAENCVKTLTVYHWLSRKKSQFFPDSELCEDLRNKMNTFIETSLKKKGLHKKCEQCGRKLSLSHKHRKCEGCFQKSRYDFNWED